MLSGTKIFQFRFSNLAKGGYKSIFALDTSLMYLCVSIVVPG